MSIGNRLPTGPGSRGGQWHDPDFRRAYQRAWRRAHPDYREREKLRRARERTRLTAPAGSGPRPFPRPAEFCACACGCRETVVAVCGFCREGMHGE